MPPRIENRAENGRFHIRDFGPQRAERGRIDHPWESLERMFSFDRKKIRETLGVLGRVVRSYRFALAAFIIPVFIRAIPEILVGPYPVGWDTIAFYVPNTLDWATGKTGLQSAPSCLEGPLG